MSNKYAPWNTARQAALELSLQSKSAYIKWHKEIKPTYLPRYPDKVYDEFVSWNDFLGTQNAFRGNIEKDRLWRPYWEAVKWAQSIASQFDLDSRVDWVDWCKTEKNLPIDIPLAPDVVYAEFKGNGWPVWLGKDVRSKLKAMGVQTHLFVICSHENLSVPGNYYTIMHAKLGISELKEKLSKHKDMRIYRIYDWDEKLSDQVNKMIEAYSKDMGDNKLFIPDLNSLLFELDCTLTWVPKLRN